MAMNLANIKTAAVDAVATALREKEGADISLQDDYKAAVAELIEPMVEAIYDALVNDAEVALPGTLQTGTIS